MKKPSSLSMSKSVNMGSTDQPSISSLNVEEEYNKALHSKSFLDMCDKVQHQLHTTISTSKHHSNKDNHDPHEVNHVNNSSNNYTNLPHFIIEPKQESMLALTSSDSVNYTNNHRTLLQDYFDITYQACIACTNLLAAMTIIRSHYHSISCLISKLSITNTCNCTMTKKLMSNLSLIVNLDNPFHTKTLAQFYYVQTHYTLLVHQLNEAHKKILTKHKFIKLIRKATGFIAAAIIALCISVHGDHAMTMRWPIRKENEVTSVGAQVDAAAKGAYIMGKDFETMSRMVQRVHDEVEHSKEVARMVMRFSTEREIVSGVAKEVAEGKMVVEEQLEELEEHVFLCLITINKSRRMVAKEMSFADR